MKSPDDAHYLEWDRNPEPKRNEFDPRVVLDGNLEHTAWLYNCTQEDTEWLTFEGETVAVEQ